MTWKQFYVWLTEVGFQFTPGDIHWAGQGFWYPELPDVSHGLEAPRPAPPWIHVFKGSTESETNGRFKRAEMAEVAASFVEGRIIEEPSEARAFVEQLLMDFDVEVGADPFVSLPFRRGASARQETAARSTVIHGNTGTRNTFGPRQRPPRTRDVLVSRGDDPEVIRDRDSGLGHMREPRFKVCGTCGRSYTRQQWDVLPLLGEQKIEADEETGESACVYTAKNCACGSTLYSDKG